MSTELANALVSSAAHAEEGRIHALFTELRRASPVQLTRPADFHPYCSLTRHTDVMEVSRKNDVFISRRPASNSRRSSAPWYAGSAASNRRLQGAPGVDWPHALNRTGQANR